MSMRCITGKYVTPTWYAPLAFALSVAGGSGCAADTHKPEATVEPSEPPVDTHQSAAGVKPSEPPVAAASGATPVPRIVAPEEAVEFPRAVALKEARHITVVDHENVAAVSSGVTGGVE